MKRKEFLSKGACACIASGALLTGSQKAFCVSAEEGTPCDQKHKFAQTYVKRLMDILNEKLDEKTRIELVRTMGQSCAKGAYGDKDSAKDKLPVEELVKKLNGRMEGNTIYFEYYANPAGLKVADGWCLCPLVEKGPEGLSGLYCECSAGYVKYMFEHFSTSKVEVELLESLKRGGKGCKFKIIVTSD